MDGVAPVEFSTRALHFRAERLMDVGCVLVCLPGSAGPGTDRTRQTVMSITTAQRIAEALEVGMEELLGEADEPDYGLSANSNRPSSPA